TMGMPDPSARSPHVLAYHSEVDAAVAAMNASLSAGDDSGTALKILDVELQGPVARQVLDRLPYGRDDLMAAARQELDDPKLRLPSNAQSRAGLVRILLLHQIDLLWWSHVPPYADQQAVERADELLSLPTLQKAGALEFRFAVQPEGWLGRGRDYARRRVAPRRRPRVSGMKFLVARAEIVALLNEIATTFSAEAPERTPRLWVNSIVRSIEHQKHLSSLGYSALLPSSHCLGYGADIEMAWFRSFGAADVLGDILFDYRDRDVLNVIDEGQAWHLCLSPDHVSDYADRAVAYCAARPAGR
ncbi:MAG: DUF5715 family protein, partial [Actinomycetota bacterium]|nr:DUF5715 family protein [Actinomycetota bacterium]